MAIPYSPPGITSITEISTSPLLPQGVSVTIPAFVGRARGYETFIESVLLTGTTAVELSKRGIILDEDDDVLAVVKASSNEAVPQVNYVLTQTTEGVDGDDVTTIARLESPDAPSAAVGATGPLTGNYRYAVVWFFETVEGVDIESGVDHSKTTSITLSSDEVDLTGLDITPPAGAGVTGRSIYRSKNLGTVDNPSWGPWYRITKISDLSTTTFTDDVDDNTAAGNREAAVGIDSGDTVFVQYQYADEEYYLPTFFENFSDVIAKYGAPFDEVGQINSELSFGVNVAVINGAGQFVCVAIPEDGDTADIGLALNKLLDEEDIDIVTVLDGSATTLTALAAHTTAAYNNKRFRIGIAGRDGVAETVSATGLRTNASALANENIQVVSPAVFTYYNGALNKDVQVGGQYMAAALAGMMAARPPMEPLTRRSVAGFSGVEARTPNAKNSDAAAGLTVIESKAGVLRVRHSISTSNTDINKREISVTLAKYDMLVDVMYALDTEVIGHYYADESASININSVVSQVLTRKVQLGYIQDFQGLIVRPVSGDPTTFNVEWQYKPTYPINNISISFSININTGSIGITGAGLGGATGLIL